MHLRWSCEQEVEYGSEHVVLAEEKEVRAAVLQGCPEETSAFQEAALLYRIRA